MVFCAVKRLRFSSRTVAQNVQEKKLRKSFQRRLCLFTVNNSQMLKCHVAPLIWSLNLHECRSLDESHHWNLSALMSAWRQTATRCPCCRVFFKKVQFAPTDVAELERASCCRAFFFFFCVCQQDHLPLLSSDSFNKTSQDNSCSSQWYEG